MIPRGAEGIGHIVTRVVVDFIPKAADGYMTADLGLVAALLGMVGQDYDRAADVLVADQRDIHTILLEAQPFVDDAALKGRLAAALDLRPDGLRVRHLTDQLDAAMKVLIDLHAAVEDAEADGAPWAGPLNARIWSFLDEHVARRAYDSAI